MTRKRLEKLKRKLQDARRGAANLHHRDLASIAKSLGRKRSRTRTKEPTFESEEFDTNVITIPDHAGGLKKGTAISIINQLEEDIFLWDEKISNEEHRQDDIDNNYE